MREEKADILIVEDDVAIARLIEIHLKAAGLSTHCCADGDGAVRLLQQRQWQLLILDHMLPGLGGMKVLRWLRGREGEVRLPVLMVTALGQTAERVQGLNEGADDYLAKPFEPEELVARVKALLRRSDTSESLSLGGIELDAEAYEVRINGQALGLRPIEFRLLHALMQKPGRVRSREYLLDHVWGQDHFVEERTVDVTVKRLRKALAEYGREDHIETVRGMGYRFVTPTKASP